MKRSARRSVLVQAVNPAAESDSASRSVSIHISEAHVKDLHQVSAYPSSFVDSAQASRIFQDVFAQGDSLWGRFFSDGQFAYANAVRRYIEQKYHRKCEKLFTYGRLTATSPHYGCSASWSYDVTCVLRGKDGAIYAIDPRLFTSMVSGETWVKAHTYPTVCEQKPTQYPKYQLVAGETFTPLDALPSGYLVDPTYRLTDIYLVKYADSAGCRDLTSVL